MENIIYCDVFHAFYFLLKIYVLFYKTQKGYLLFTGAIPTQNIK